MTSWWKYSKRIGICTDTVYSFENEEIKLFAIEFIFVLLNEVISGINWN